MTTVTSTERPRTMSERLDPRNWSLVAKLAVVGLVPTVLALSIGALRVVDQASVAEELGRGNSLVDVHRQVEALTGALQAERNAAVVFVADNRLGDRARIDETQAATDQAIQATTAQLDVAEEQAPALATARRQAETTLGQLPVIRSQVAGGPTPVVDITDRYTSVVQRTLALDRAVVGRLQTADTASTTTALAAGLNAREALELERTVINGAIAAGQLDGAQRTQVTGAEAAFQTAAGDFQASAAADPVGFETVIAGPTLDQRNTLRDNVVGSPEGGPVLVDPAAWNGAVDRSVETTTQAIGEAEQSLVASRSAAAEQAGNTAGLNSVLLMLTLLLTAAIIWLLGSQMVRSLRLLRSSALDVAEHRLPEAVQSMRSGQTPNALVEPVPLDSRDEIGQVARAFDAVHGQAVRLAADQAALQQNVNAMFVNLSRRSQALVERQLQLIEQLESNEQDPDQLSSLFQLDHLATRMRRNSENLLVLAGTDLAKRNVAPVQVVDVLRAAVSEVEQYQRVVVQTPPNATVAGRAANDLVHLLAELLDNATNFSPPDSQVVMSTTRTADESLLIEISDRGVGMMDSELVDANQRLSGPSEVDVSASRRMGLFVVGRLASRHRVGVRLASGAVGGGSGGLSASVTVPPSLVPSAQQHQEPRPGGPGPDQFPAPAALPEPPAPVPAPSAAAPGPASDAGAPARTAVNGSGRSLPSLVAGSDGPVTPTFETGRATHTGSRNGASAALPTRTPGSSLRRNPGSGEGQQSSPNGSAPGSLQAFAPAQGPDGDTHEERSPADVFTPSGEQPATGDGDTAPAGDSLPPRNGNGIPSGRGPGDDGGPAGSDEEPPTGSAADDDASSGTETSGRAIGAAGAGLLGATGIAGAAAAARPADRDMDDTLVMDAAIGDGPPADAGTAPAVQTPEDSATGSATADAFGSGADRTEAEALSGSTTAVGTGTAPEDSADGPAPDATDAATAEAGDAAAPVATTGVEAPTGADPGETTGSGTPENGPSAGAGTDPDRAAARATDGTDRPGAADAPGHPDSATDTDTGEGEDDGAGYDPGADPRTAALPLVRPSGREPMGGPPGGRNGARPSPSPRPVMPGGRASLAPGRRGPGPAPGPHGPARQGPGPQSPAPAGSPAGETNGAPPPLPKRRTPVRDAVGAGPAPAGPQEELFAPKVPVEGDRGQLRRPGAVESARVQNSFEMGQTTPIFDDIASAWFRSNRSVPVRWQDGSPEGGGAAPAPEAPPSDEAPASDDTGEPGFTSPADEAWRQAREVTDDGVETVHPDETTSAGLPKRRPRARLLPGSAAGSTVLSSPPPEARNAESVRGRLASYQQGVRQGRESASGLAHGNRSADGTPEPSGDRSNPSDPEEHQ
ncbi:nitrate- and nitrite sensing domain-containing protein [Pseudonocardia nematodicida]|uniref:histidine kinase n=1 Tax=Pseudonocardia nematodicida TaxID=1206997 RepID=A0ABV1KBK4_9PSEU